MNGLTRNLLAASSALAVAAACGAAAAEQAPPAPVSGADARAVDEVVVTARRRDERLQDVPISVQAYNQEVLTSQAIDRVADLEQVAPTLRITPTSSRRNTSAVELRGIGNVDTSVTQDVATAFYMNEVVESRPIGLNQSLYDVESVQVLLGPQGTLFGRNATAGAVLISTKRPTDEFGGEVMAAVGNYDRKDVSAILNLPLGDKLSVRFAGQRLTRSGYTLNIVSGEDLDDEQVTTLRFSALFRPTDGFQNLTVADYYDSASNGTGSSINAIRPCPAAPGTPGVTSPAATCRVIFAAPLAAALTAQLARGPREVAYNSATGETATAWGVSNITTWDLTDDLVVKNILGYRHIDLESFADHDGTTLSILSIGPVTQNGHQWSNELQLQGQFADQVDWIAGLYYFREEVDEQSNSFQLGSTVASINNGTAVNTSKSIFVQGTWRVPAIEGLSLTAGARWTHDDREAELRNRTGTGACRLVNASNVPLNPCKRELSASFDQPTWTLTADYKPTDNILFYIASRRGYRAGGFSLRATSLAQSQSFDPEIVTDVELGAKGSWRLGGARLEGSVAVYKNSYEDIQRTVSGVVGGILTTSVLNAAKAEIKGLEANASIEPATGLKFSAFYGYVDAVHTEFNTVIGGVPTTLTDIPFGVSEHNLGGAVTWTPIDGNAGRVSATLAFSTHSPSYSQQTLPVLEPESRVGWQQLTNLTVNWDDIAQSPVSAQFFVRNLFDQENVQSVLAVAGQLGFSNRVYSEPRMFGVRLTYRFGDGR